MMLRVLTLLIFGHIELPSVSTYTLPVASDSSLNSSSQFERSHDHVTRDVGYVYSPGISSHKIHSAAVTWNEARLICKAEFAHLAIINSQAESQAIARLFEKSYPHVGSSNPSNAFIGFHDLFREGLYVTIHDESIAEAGFEEWFPDQPDSAFVSENCGAIVNNGQLNDVDCSDSYAFVCERPYLIQVTSGTPIAVTEQLPDVISTTFTSRVKIGEETTAGHPEHGSSDSTIRSGVNFNSTSMSGTESFGSLSTETPAEKPSSFETSVTSKLSVVTVLEEPEKSDKDVEVDYAPDILPDFPEDDHTPDEFHIVDPIAKATTARPQVNITSIESDITSGSSLTTKGDGLVKLDEEDKDDPNTFPGLHPAMTTMKPQQKKASPDSTSKSGVTSDSTSLAQTVVSGCPDVSPITGIINLDCPASQCSETPFGCCPDNVTTAEGNDYEGCPIPCNKSAFGCCPDEKTAAAGEDNLGCCNVTAHGCCPDGFRTASGPDGEGCDGKETSTVTTPGDEDGVTTTSAIEDATTSEAEVTTTSQVAKTTVSEVEEGCVNSEFGCCPDQKSTAAGTSSGCGCENTEFKCCSDGITPAKGENYTGCTCDASKYGCCPDGIEEAQGDSFEGCLTVPTNPAVACALERDRGPCSDFTVRWFFDTEYGGCSRFSYGGCGGNENRFKSQDECKDVCVEPKGRDACFLPKISGPCEEYHPTWYFDTERKQCGQFIYKGCIGNANKFKTRDECEKLCVIPDDIAACEQSKEVGPCEGNFTRWYFNKESDSCEEFAYGGCKANKNNFPNQISCRQECLTPGRSKMPVKVKVSADEGPFPEGSEFSIVCSVDGFPLPRVEWFKDDYPIQRDNRITIPAANRLIITDAEKSDSGKYRCQAANDVTSDADTVDITVAGIYIHPNCQDNSFFARCDLIVKGNFCKHQYYAKFCCRSCTEAGQPPARGPHVNETRRKRRSVLSLS